MGPTSPRVSVAVPVYNGERHLPAAVESVLGQTFTDFELVLCDNASTDCTEELCRGYAARDKRVRYHRNPRNIGLSANFDLAAALCSARLVKWAASDDVLGPNCLADCVHLLDENPKVVLAVPAGRLIDAHGDPVPPPRDVLRPIVWPTDTVGRVRRFIDMLTTKESIAVMLYLYGVFRAEKLSGCLTLPRYPMSDQETLLAALLAGEFAETERPSLAIRMHDESFGSGVHTDPARIWRSMHPDEPPPRPIGLWHHRRHRRILSMLAGADLPMLDRGSLQAHYVYRVGRQLALGKMEGARRRLQALRANR